jgi:fatty-acyl-CoA synthase
VVGRPDDQWGEVPVAFVTTHGRRDLDVDEVREFLQARLARFKVPKAVAVVDELPKTATGKIQKFVLRDRAR